MLHTGPLQMLFHQQCSKFLTVACPLVPTSARSGSGSTSSTRTPSGVWRTSTSGRPARDTAAATETASTSGACATRDSPDQTATPAPPSRSVSPLLIWSMRAVCHTQLVVFIFLFLQASLKERFDWDGAAGPQWQVLEGGRPCTDCGVLVEGTALYFGGADARQVVTADLDLRGAKWELSFISGVLMMSEFNLVLWHLEYKSAV